MAKAADSLYFLCDTTITPSRRSGRTTTEASTAATILCTGYKQITDDGLECYYLAPALDPVKNYLNYEEDTYHA